MFFVPLGHLKNKDWFRRDRMSDVQQELFRRALTHGLRQSKVLLRDFFDWEGSHTTAYRATFRGFIGFLEALSRMNGLWSEPTHAEEADRSTRCGTRTGCRSRRSRCANDPGRLLGVGNGGARGASGRLDGRGPVDRRRARTRGRTVRSRQGGSRSRSRRRPATARSRTAHPRMTCRRPQCRNSDEVRLGRVERPGRVAVDGARDPEVGGEHVQLEVRMPSTGRRAGDEEEVGDHAGLVGAEHASELVRVARRPRTRAPSRGTGG